MRETHEQLQLAKAFHLLSLSLSCTFTHSNFSRFASLFGKMTLSGIVLILNLINISKHCLLNHIQGGRMFSRKPVVILQESYETGNDITERPACQGQ